MLERTLGIMALRAVVDQRPTGKRRDDKVRDVFRIVGGIEQHMPAIDGNPGEFAVQLL